MGKLDNHRQKIKLDTYIYDRKLNSKLIKDLYVRPEIIKIPTRKHREKSP